MKFTVIPVTPYQQNCSLIWCEETREAALVDPGGEAERLLAEVERRGLRLVRVLLTHGHLDHVGAAAEIGARLGIPVEGPQRDDVMLFQSLPQQAQRFGFPPAQPFTPDRWLEEGDRVEVGRLSLEVLHCPGHSPGHVVFFHAPSRLAFVGDVLFQGSIGRSDFPGGNYEQLIASIRGKLFALGDDVAFVPGHGGMSTMGEERVSNPFVGDGA